MPISRDSIIQTIQQNANNNGIPYGPLIEAGCSKVGPLLMKTTGAPENR